MTTDSDLFWQLFTTSGHVGAYLLYIWNGESAGTSQNQDRGTDRKFVPSSYEGGESVPEDHGR